MAEKNSGGEQSGTLSEKTSLGERIKTMKELGEKIERYQKLINDMRVKDGHSEPDLKFAEEILEDLIEEKESRQQLGQ